MLDEIKAHISSKFLKVHCDPEICSLIQTAVCIFSSFTRMMNPHDSSIEVGLDNSFSTHSFTGKITMIQPEFRDATMYTNYSCFYVAYWY